METNHILGYGMHGDVGEMLCTSRRIMAALRAFMSHFSRSLKHPNLCKAPLALLGAACFDADNIQVVENPSHGHGS